LQERNEKSRRSGSWFDKVDERLRRLEIAVACLVVATASPKVGGPAPSDVVSAVAREASRFVS
jgi:hypothetical protein